MTYKYFVVSVSLIFTAFYGFSQDSAYYYTAFNNQDDSLKQKLHLIIDNHTEFPYTSSSTDVWDILKDTDKDTANPNNVILIYSNRSVNAAQEYSSGSGWNREHVWAKSRGNFGTSKGAGTDVHHLRPCDISVNSTRNNRNFDDCVNCVDVIDNGFNTGSKRSSSMWTFEPPDNVKGDVARMIFYMVVRYEGDGNEPDLELTNTLQVKTSKLPLHASLATLLTWHRLDTVSDWERNRNNIIYNNYQGNKNPFIDYPKLAEYLWGDSTGVVWKPVSTVGIEEETTTGYKIFPNPANGGCEIDCLSVPDEVIVLNSLGEEVLKLQPNANSFFLDLTAQPTGVYVLQLNFNGQFKREKLILEK